MSTLLLPSGNHLALPERWTGLAFQGLLKQELEVLEDDSATSLEHLF